jgi:hypothetical protein
LQDPPREDPEPNLKVKDERASRRRDGRRNAADIMQENGEMKGSLEFKGIGDAFESSCTRRWGRMWRK